MSEITSVLSFLSTIFLAITGTMLKMAWDDIRDIRHDLNRHVADYSVHRQPA